MSAPADFLFVCDGPTCGERGGHEIAERWEDLLVDQNRWERCRVVRAICFGQCPTGPNAYVPSQDRFLFGLDASRAEETLSEIAEEKAEEKSVS